MYVHITLILGYTHDYIPNMSKHILAHKAEGGWEVGSTKK